MNTNIRNPYWRGIIPVAGLSVFFLAITLLVYGLAWIGLVEPTLDWIGLIFTLAFGLIALIVWLSGTRQVRRIKNFLTSDRPMVSWTYSEAEWEQIKEKLWQEERGDWKIQFGCLTVLLALAGMLTGVLIGVEHGFAQALGFGMIGLVAGGCVGGLIGALVAGGNHFSAVLARRDLRPGQVALGRGEIYATGDYFRANGMRSHIQRVELIPGRPASLEIQIKMPPRVRMPDEEIWQIPVPPQWVQQVEEILPDFVPEI